LKTSNQSFWLEKAWLADGWCADVRLQIDPTGEIVSVSTGSLQSGDEAVSGAIIPGLPNLHSHAFQRACAGLTEHRHSDSPGSQDSFWTWREVLHSFVTRLGPDDQGAIACQLYLEMLKSGYTAVGEFHYLHKDPSGAAYADPAEMSRRLIIAAEQVGIGMTLLPVLYSVGGYRGVEINAGQRRYVLEVEKFIDQVSTLEGIATGNPSLRIGIAPHSVRQVPAEQMFDVLNGIQGIDPSMPVHIHAAEQVRDVDEHVAATGARPVEWLLANAPVNEHWCLVHATHVNVDEVAGMATANAVAGLCPTTEANLGDGLFPLEAYLAQGGRWGIGSDSHISVSPVEELRWLEYGQRLATLTRNVAAPRGGQGQGGSTAARLCRDALRGGAQALGRTIGALAPGHRADLVVLDTDHPLLYGRRDDRLLDTWIFSGNTPTVSHVMTSGKWVIRDGHHQDEEAIAQNFRKVMMKLAS
jgi:formimidoylglutamate deiminase